MARRTIPYPVRAGLGGMTGFDNLVQGNPVDLKEGINIRPGRGSLWLKRPGTTTHKTLGLTGGEYPIGMYFYYNLSGTEKIISVTSAGKVLDASASPITTIHTFANPNKYPSFATFEGEVYIFNGKDPGIAWDGTTKTELTANVPAEWAGDNPAGVIAHANRLWAFRANSNRLYWTPLLNGKNWIAAGSGSLVVGASGSIVTAQVWQDRLFIFLSDGTIYWLDNSNADVTLWTSKRIMGNSFKTPAPVNARCVVQGMNDIFFMDALGHIYSIRGIIETGDYSKSDITLLDDSRFIDYINTNIDFTSLSLPFLMYNSDEDAILAFNKSKGSSQAGTDVALVFYSLTRKWFVWRGDGTKESGYYDCYGGANSTTNKPYTCRLGSSASIWSLRHTSLLDLDTTLANQDVVRNGINASLVTEIWDFGMPEETKFLRALRITTTLAKTEINYRINKKGIDTPEAILQFNSVVGGEFPFKLSGSVNKYDKFATRGGQEFIVPLNDRGKKIKVTVTNDIPNDELGISLFIVDIKPIGIQRTGKEID